MALEIASSAVEISPSPFVNKNKIGKIEIHDSEDLHFGPKFIGSTVNYYEGIQRKRKIYAAIVIALSLMLVIILVFVLLQYLNRQDSANNITVPPPTETPTTSVTQITDTTGTTSSPTEPTSPIPPEDWLVPYSVWSTDHALICNEIVSNNNGKRMAMTVSIDSNKGCNTLEDLKILQSKSGIHYNFYLSQSGKTYEGFGWECAPEYNYRYSRNNIIIAICGPFNFIQEKILEKLLKSGVDYKNLDSNYNVIPECCRGFNDRSGPGKDINLHLIRKYNAMFQNQNCIQNEPCRKYS